MADNLAADGRGGSRNYLTLHYALSLPAGHPGAAARKIRFATFGCLLIIGVFPRVTMGSVAPGSFLNKGDGGGGWNLLELA
jgi:hypothetical protein